MALKVGDPVKVVLSDREWPYAHAVTGDVVWVSNDGWVLVREHESQQMVLVSSEAVEEGSKS